jgi:hypothetical protein
MENSMKEAMKNPGKQPDIGFGKPKPDLEWVKPMQMPPPPPKKK